MPHDGGKICLISLQEVVIKSHLIARSWHASCVRACMRASERFPASSGNPEERRNTCCRLESEQTTGIWAVCLAACLLHRLAVHLLISESSLLERPRLRLRAQGSSSALILVVFGDAFKVGILPCAGSLPPHLLLCPCRICLLLHFPALSLFWPPAEHAATMFAMFTSMIFVHLCSIAVKCAFCSSPQGSQSDWPFTRWRLMASRGWEVTTSHSRQASRGRRPTSALLSRRLRAQPRAPTCSPARRRNRYHTSSQQIRLDPLCRCPESGGKNTSAASRSRKKRKAKSFFSQVFWQLLTALFCCRWVP